MLFHRAGNARPREPKSRPTRPFQELAIDLHNFYTDWHDIIHMGHDTTDSLPWDTGAPNIIWSDQFILSKEWGFWHNLRRAMGRPRLWWKIFLEQYGQAYIRTQESWLVPFCSISKDWLSTYLQHKSSLDGLFRTHFQLATVLFAPEWQHSAKEADEQERSHTDSEQVEHYYNQHVCALPGICNMAMQDANKIWDVYGDGMWRYLIEEIRDFRAVPHKGLGEATYVVPWLFILFTLLLSHNVMMRLCLSDLMKVSTAHNPKWKFPFRSRW